ncbi:hypothetical protein LWI28_007754 [Acer negundo]|uniref:K+ potassium transporter integral membrane domain-containing protein n=1 Tax=Acer negundo TaxID=4023 RepID=A0AAD5ILN6_ACENE|nr:hypothetical protein LWI28_007754 [Acer negundo]
MSSDEVKDHTEESLQDVASQEFEGKKNSHSKLRRYDSMEMESGMVSGHLRHGSKKILNWSIILHLAFQSIGIVYGDLGTSPLYVLPGTFQNAVKNAEDILGVVSLIFYTITLIPLINYVFIVLRATDRGDGGTFALYSLICRYVKVGLIPNQQAEDSNVSNLNLVLPGNGRHLRRAEAFKSKLKNSQFTKLSVLLATLLGTFMVIGDGILTPCISDMSDSLQEISLDIESPRFSVKLISMDIQSPKVSVHQHHDSKVVGWSIIFQLAFRSTILVYGDLGTSPLYVLSSTFPEGVKHTDDILGVGRLVS